MLKKYEVLRRVAEEKIVAVLRAKDDEQAERGVEAILEGGLHCAELTFTTPYAHTVLERLSRRYGEEELLLCAGSVLDAETARIAILSGAKYLVTPTLSEDVVKVANRYGVPVVAGVGTPTEAVAALECGVDVVKLFPASCYPYRVIKDWKAPLPALEIMPTGGVSAANLADWLKAGAFACGVGGSLFDGLKTGNYAMIASEAKKLKEIANGLK